MVFTENKVEGVKIAYIGGGSRGWAWGLMSDLAGVDDMNGDVYLYDIDYEAAQHNEIIGNKYNDLPDCRSKWNYKAVKTIKEALTGANIVIISILPGTFDDMEADVHIPEKYGIYQSVGDSTGPGGIVRALRTIPMIEEIALAVKEYSPSAWVINYTNPMSLCIKALYGAFPDIKAFGCCHEVFGTQKVLAAALDDILGIKGVSRQEIKVNVVGVNHFTWLTEAHYKNIDLFDVYRRFAGKYKESGFSTPGLGNWMNDFFSSKERVKLDLFLRYGCIAAAGDRHLAEFCPGGWYLDNPEQVKKWGFALTPVSWRKKNLTERLEKSKRLMSGEESVKINGTGEEGVTQIRALLGLCELTSNINIPNIGQIPNLPIGSVVETNAVFRSDCVSPVFAGNVPDKIYPLVSRICGEQEIVAKAAERRDIEGAFGAFVNDPLVRLSVSDARKLFNEMINAAKGYLSDYLK